MHHLRETAGLLTLGLILISGTACSDSSTFVPGSEIGIPPAPVAVAPATQPEAVNLTVAVHDAPAPSIREAWVTFTGVSARVAGGGWIAIEGPGEVTVDLLTLVRGRTLVLAEAEVPAGSYDALRVDISAARVVDANGVSRDVPLPSPGVGVEHPVGFRCLTGQPQVVVLDFPVEPSFRLATAGVAFTPTIVTDSVRVAP